MASDAGLLRLGVRRFSPIPIAELVALFFLLFHFGDMINCFADRDLDAVYKTRLSEAVFGLGPRNVLWQITLTVLAAIGVSIHLACVTGHYDLVLLVLFGLSLAAQYSVGPIRFKSRGPLQVVALWAVIFVGPMLLVARTFGSTLEWPLLALIAAYGAMQEGIILINTAEDLPEDRADNIRTTAVALGLRNCISLALAMVTVSGAIVIALFARVGHVRSVLPLCAAWLWVVWEIARISALVRGRDEVAAIKAFRPRARRMPLWITATAWTSLWAAWTSTH